MKLCKSPFPLLSSDDILFSLSFFDVLGKLWLTAR